MELSWTTFVLEIVNFLVLVWILKRFLYKPVLDVIARRKAGIEKRLSDAQELHTEAQALQKQYEGRLTEWQEERQQARQTLAEELAAERATRMQQLREALQQEQEKAHVARERQEADTLRRLEQSALQQGARFAARLLGTAAGAEVHDRLVQLFLDELSALAPEQVSRLRANAGQVGQVRVTSAFPLEPATRDRLQRALQPLHPESVSCEFAEDGELLAGLRVELGAWTLAANLQDELKGFAELAHGD
jgi:F-type H+-transporting ATPase subunit b